MALSDAPTLSEQSHVDGLVLDLLRCLSAASGVGVANLDNPGVRQRLRDVGQRLLVLSPLLVHVVTQARLHLPEMVEAMRGDPRASPLLDPVSTKQPPAGKPSRDN